MLVIMMLGCSSQAAFGDRYEDAYCEAIEACGWYTGEVLETTRETDCVEGYQASLWAADRCDWTLDDERDDACIEEMETCGENVATLCARDLFGCE